MSAAKPGRFAPRTDGCSVCARRGNGRTAAEVKNDLLISLRQRLRTELTLRRGFETRTAQTVGEALLERSPRVGVEDDLVAPAARSAAPERDSAALAGFREGCHRAAATHAASPID